MTANLTITASQMKRIVADLARRDARFAKVIDAHPLCTIGRNPKPVSHFEALVESVISQQLAVKAADTIYGRVKGLAQGRVVPARIAAISEKDMRGAGVSGAKFKTIQGLADAALTKKIKINQLHKVDSDEEKVRFADLELDEATHEVRRAGNLIELSPTEFLLLRYLMINADRVVSKSQILDHVWQYDFRGDAGIVETYISYLRKKIDIYDPALIHTVRGVGYRLRLPARK